MKLPCCILHTVERGQSQGSQHIDILLSHSSFSNFIDPLGISIVVWFWAHHQQPFSYFTVVIQDFCSGILNLPMMIRLFIEITKSVASSDFGETHWLLHCHVSQWPLDTSPLESLGKNFWMSYSWKSWFEMGAEGAATSLNALPLVRLLFFFFCLVRFWYWGSDNMICLCSPSLQPQSCWERPSKAAGFQRS